MKVLYMLMYITYVSPNDGEPKPPRLLMQDDHPVATRVVLVFLLAVYCVDNLLWLVLQSYCLLLLYYR